MFSDYFSLVILQPWSMTRKPLMIGKEYQGWWRGQRPYFFRTVSIFLYSLQHVEIKKSRSQSFALYSCGSAQLANHWHHLACVCVHTSQPGSCRIFAKKHKRGCKIAAGFRATFLGEKFAKVQMHCQHFLRFASFSPILSFQQSNFCWQKMRFDFTLHHWVILAFLITLMATGSWSLVLSPA